jgi:hypothetical protein
MNCIFRFLIGQVDKRTLDKYQTEAREKTQQEPCGVGRVFDAQVNARITNK